MSFLRNLQNLGLNRKSRTSRRMRRMTPWASLAQIEALEGRALLSTATIGTVAGSGARGFAGDNGAATGAAMKTPINSVVDSAGNIFIADQYNLRVREVVKATGNIITVAGSGGGGQLGGYTGDGGQATAAQLSNVSALALDGKGNLFIGDFTNHVVRAVDLTSGIITTVAGKPGVGAPYVPAVSDGQLATSIQLGNPAALAVDNLGNLLIADSADHVVLKVDMTTHTIRAVAGNGTTSTSDGGVSGDGGQASLAQLNSPRGLAVDGQGNLFISDMLAMNVRKVDQATGVISTVAGIAGFAYYSGDGGPASAAKLYTPQGIAVDGQGNLYIADTANNRIREVVKATGIINTVVGNGTLGFSGDGGNPLAAQLNNPQGIAVDSQGNLYVSDTQNQRIRAVTFSAPTTVGTTTSLSTNNASAVYGQVVAFTATVSPSAASGLTPGGTVQFVVDGLNYGAPVALSQGRASVSVSGLGAGVHTVGASYAGDSNFGTSAASNLSQSLSKAVLVVKANAASGRAGNPLPALTSSYSGFVNGDTAAVLTSVPTVSTTATTASLAGAYPISVSGGAAKNYAIATQGSTLTLAPPIKPTSVKGIYSGTKLTGLTIVFNGPMSAASVQKLANYVVAAPGKDGKYGTKDDVKVALLSATYNASTSTLTLKLKSAVASTPGLQLKGTGLADVAGGLIDGARTGKPGSILTATFKGKTVVF